MVKCGCNDTVDSMFLVGFRMNFYGQIDVEFEEWDFDSGCDN